MAGRETHSPRDSHRDKTSGGRHDHILPRQGSGRMASKLANESHRLHQKAHELIPGGVNSPVRNYPPYPLFVASANGSKFRTVDGEKYLDYCMAYGALLDGHAPPEIVEAV